MCRTAAARPSIAHSRAAIVRGRALTMETHSRVPYEPRVGVRITHREICAER